MLPQERTLLSAAAALLYVRHFRTAGKRRSFMLKRPSIGSFPEIEGFQMREGTRRDAEQNLG